MAGTHATRALRFCMLTTFYPPWHFGGDALQVERLAHALADRGHGVTVVHSPEVHRLLRGTIEHPPRHHPGVEVVALEETLPSLVRTYLAGRPFRARGRLEEVLGRGYDVVHFHNPSLLGAPALLGMGAGLKLYTAHEQWLLCPSHVLWRSRGGICEDPPCLTCELSHRRPPQPWRRTGLLERSLAHLDTLIVPSRASARLHARFEHTVPIEVLEHFVPEPAAGQPDSGDGARPYFLYAGRLEPVKGVGTLIDAFARHAPADLVVAGDGGLARRLRRQARRLSHVRFTGWESGSRLDSLFAGALAVVVPSVGHESFGLVTAEAFAHRTPAIVRGIGALGELAEETGAALTYDSPAELDHALARLAGDPALRTRLATRARAAYEERFTPAAHLDRYLTLIDRLKPGSLTRAGEGARPA